MKQNGGGNRDNTAGGDRRLHTIDSAMGDLSMSRGGIVSPVLHELENSLSNNHLPQIKSTN